MEICENCPDIEYCQTCGCEHTCVICGGEGTVNGMDWYDPTFEYELYNDPLAPCPSCKGSGRAEDMTFC